MLIAGGSSVILSTLGCDVHQYRISISYSDITHRMLMPREKARYDGEILQEKIARE